MKGYAIYCSPIFLDTSHNKNCDYDAHFQIIGSAVRIYPGRLKLPSFTVLYRTKHSLRTCCGTILQHLNTRFCLYSPCIPQILFLLPVYSPDFVFTPCVLPRFHLYSPCTPQISNVLPVYTTKWIKSD